MNFAKYPLLEPEHPRQTACLKRDGSVKMRGSFSSGQTTVFAGVGLH